MIIKSIPKCVAFLVQSVDGVEYQLVAANGTIFATDTLRGRDVLLEQESDENNPRIYEN